ncbi:hypothetical protein CC78DRAFT_566579 [Lojkania enalia]|uniref:UBA domain-containing protein n=1 Tax=Lojkania enalia TaxID=147567 RepID=A0A9P4KDU7_9PLEO|nr:hypothetical protein CC78DRAFT_566579 [Didymosphaeria enalia]
MTRIIQDSDDEFDDALEQSPAQSRHRDASQQPSNKISVPRKLGTGSTAESLKRTFEAAHRAHFQSKTIQSIPTAPHEQYEDELSMSQSESKSKRRKTMIEMSPHKSPGIESQGRRSLKTYGRSKSLFSSPYLGVEREGLQPPKDNTTDSIWDLEETIGMQYVEREPMALFPEGSSTIPDATATQQQLMEEVMAPAFRGLEPGSGIDLPHLEPEKSSVPWSEFLKSPGTNELETVHSNLQCQPFSHIDAASQQHIASGPSDPIFVTCKGSPHVQSPDLSQDSRCTPLPNEHRSKDTEKLPKSNSLVNEHISSAEQGMLVRPKEHEQQNEIVLATSGEERKQQSYPTSESDDCLAGGQLSQEQYKPRPSRSRSWKVLEQTSIDYSVKPEKASRKKSKRSKTTGWMEAIDVTMTPRRVRQICEMGFTPSTAQRALKESNGDVSRTVEWLVTNGSMEDTDELGSPRSSRLRAKAKKSSLTLDKPTEGLEPSLGKERSSPQKINRRVSFSIRNEADAILIGASRNVPVENLIAPEHVELAENKHPQAGIHSPKGKETMLQEAEKIRDVSPQVPEAHAINSVLSRKPKRRKTTLDQPESVLEEYQDVALEPVKEKKRGRGRPRKEPNPSISAVAEPEDQSIVNVDSMAPADSVNSGQGIDNALQKMGLNVSPIVDLAKDRNADQYPQGGAGAIEPPTSTPPSKTMPVPVETTQTPEKQTKPANPAHSPLSKGKVPYRVGLSKRARIAPLLKIVKK